MGVCVPNLWSVSFFVWPGDVTQTKNYINWYIHTYTSEFKNIRLLASRRFRKYTMFLILHFLPLKNLWPKKSYPTEILNLLPKPTEIVLIKMILYKKEVTRKNSHDEYLEIFSCDIACIGTEYFNNKRAKLASSSLELFYWIEGFWHSYQPIRCPQIINFP